jgi:RNA polymerase-binding transcription factor DksA
MTKQELDKYRDKLLRLGERLKGNVGRLAGEALQQTGGERSGNLSNAPMHPADLGTDQFEEEVTLGLLENEEHIQEEIAAAIGRIDAGTFGRCEDCGRDIAASRLDAVPYARYCMECARDREKEGIRP